MSAFGPPVLCGAITSPVDASDSTGTNVGMLHDRKWGTRCTEAYGEMPGVGGAKCLEKGSARNPSPRHGGGQGRAVGLPAVRVPRVGPDYIATAALRVCRSRRQPVDGGRPRAIDAGRRGFVFRYF